MTPPHDLTAEVSAALRARVGIVDDDALSCALQARLVTLLGYAAEPLTDVEASIRRALAGEFSVLLLDLGMPGVDGFEALARLRAEEQRAARAPLPVIAVTGYASTADRLRCLMAGFNDHLAKPVEVDALGAAIARCIGASVAADADADAVSNDAARLRATAQRLMQLKPKDRRFGPSILETFALRSQQLIEALGEAARLRDAAEAGLAAESLRASAEFMGALGLAELAQQARTTAAAADFEGLRSVLASIGHEHQAVLTVLLSQRRKPPAAEDGESESP